MRTACGCCLTHREVDALTDKHAVPEDGAIPLEQMPNKKIKFLQQLRMLLWRFNVVYWRAPQYTLFRIFLTIVIVRRMCLMCVQMRFSMWLACRGQHAVPTTQGLVFGSMFWGIGRTLNTLTDVSNNLGSLFASVRCFPCLLAFVPLAPHSIVPLHR